MLLFTHEKTKSSLNFLKYPSLRDHPRHTGQLWLKGKRLDDNAEGLWRIHDGIYDFSDFIRIHPGGSDWLELSKGTDITEAFEAHHISTIPESILSRFLVRKTTAPRNSPFTFHEDGFYRTLKRKIRPIVKHQVPQSVCRPSEIIADALFFLYISCAFLAAKSNSLWWATLAAIFLALNTACAHNFFHRRDNFRMYYFDFSLMSSRDWRTTHVLSHHIYTNTVYDYEISFCEPFLQYMPVKKTWLVKYGSWIYSPVIAVFTFSASYIRMWLQVLEDGIHTVSLNALLPLTVPLFMYLTTERTLLEVLILFGWIVTVGGTHFGIVGLNAAHHHPDIFHDGDAPRSLDWGLHQVDAVGDRSDINWSHFLVLTNFGEHTLHHLFPTLDHGYHKYLHAALAETCKEFGVKVRQTTQLELVKGQYQQLARETPRN